MPNIYFSVFELLVFSLFAWCFWQSWQTGPSRVLRLLFGALFGVMLELATIRQLNSYHYGQFIVMVFDVPLCIGLAWGAIIDSVMEFSDASNLPYWLRPILDGLLALSIDLATDSIAIRLGMWNWGREFDYQYFGVPFANFWAWFWVVSSFSLGYRLLAQRGGWAGQWLSAVSALLVGLVGVLGTNALIVFVVREPIYRNILIGLVLLGALTIILVKRPNLQQHTFTGPVLWVPLSLHLYFLIAGMVSGTIFAPLVLFPIAIVLLVGSLWLHKKSLKALAKNRHLT